MATKKTTAKKAPASKAPKSIPAAQRPKKTKVAKAEAAAHKAESAEAKPAKSKAAKPSKEKKVSCIDAAAQVLAASKTPMNTKEMIEAMAAKELWVSPGGKTPSATLYSSIIREIATKGKDARFTKTERGKFTTSK